MKPSKILIFIYFVLRNFLLIFQNFKLFQKKIGPL